MDEKNTGGTQSPKTVNAALSGLRKEMRRSYKKSRQNFNEQVNFNAQEHALLKGMMAKEGWTNVSGFIKEKLFGAGGAEGKFRKTISGEDRTPAIEVLKDLLMNNYAMHEYINIRNRRNGEVFQRLVKEATGDEEKVRWAAQFASDMMKTMDDGRQIDGAFLVFLDEIAKALGIEVKIDRKTYLRALPDEEIDAYLKENWKDTMSEYNDEKIRRLQEKEKQKTGKVYGSDGWELDQKQKDEGKE